MNPQQQHRLHKPNEPCDNAGKMLGKFWYFICKFSSSNYWTLNFWKCINHFLWKTHYAVYREILKYTIAHFYLFVLIGQLRSSQLALVHRSLTTKLYKTIFAIFSYEVHFDSDRWSNEMLEFWPKRNINCFIIIRWKSV